MNSLIFMGRLTADPEVRYTTGENATCIANFNLAVDKKYKKKNDPDAPTADFFRITAMGRLGEFTEKYLHKGTKIVMSGRVENNNYVNKDGVKVYGFQFIAESIEFAESKKAAEANGVNTANADFMKTDESINGDLPF